MPAVVHCKFLQGACRPKILYSIKLTTRLSEFFRNALVQLKNRNPGSRTYDAINAHAQEIFFYKSSGLWICR